MHREKLLLLHGAVGSKDQFQNLIHLLDADLEIYTLNFPGHGGEEVPSNSFSIECFAHHVAEWLEKNKLQSINIFGYSMGGYVGLYLAYHYPEKIKKIFTLGTKFHWNHQIAEKEIKMLDPAKIEEKVPSFASALSHRHAPQDWKQVVNKTVEMMIGLGKKNALTDSYFSSISQSVIVSVGDQDAMVSIEETADVCRKIKNGKLIVIPHSAHPIEKVNMQKLVPEMLRFFT